MNVAFVFYVEDRSEVLNWYATVTFATFSLDNSIVTLDIEGKPVFLLVVKDSIYVDLD